MWILLFQAEKRMNFKDDLGQLLEVLRVIRRDHLKETPPPGKPYWYVSSPFLISWPFCARHLGYYDQMFVVIVLFSGNLFRIGSGTSTGKVNLRWSGATRGAGSRMARIHRAVAAAALVIHQGTTSTISPMKMLGDRGIRPKMMVRITRGDNPNCFKLIFTCNLASSVSCLLLQHFLSTPPPFLLFFISCK